MKPEKEDREEIKKALQEIFPPMGDDAGLRRDLWPAMLRRIEEQHAVAVPWYDWALAAALLALAFLFPKMALLFAYHL